MNDINQLNTYVLQGSRKVGKPSYTLAAQSDFHGPLNYSSTRLFQAVYQALCSGLSYSTDVREFVKDKMNDILTSEVLEAQYSNTPVEGGLLGMDIFYARRTIEPWLKRLANREAIVHHQLHVGKKIRNLSYSTHRFSTAVVEAIDDEEGVVTFCCTKRGSRKRWTAHIPGNNPSLIQAITEAKYPSNVKEISSEQGLTTLSIDLGSNDSLFFNKDHKTAQAMQ